MRIVIALALGLLASDPCQRNIPQPPNFTCEQLRGPAADGCEWRMDATCQQKARSAYFRAMRIIMAGACRAAEAARATYNSETARSETLFNECLENGGDPVICAAQRDSRQDRLDQKLQQALQDANNAIDWGSLGAAGAMQAAVTQCCEEICEDD